MPKSALQPDVLSEVIGSIYDCAIDPGHWPETLEVIRLALDCFNGQLSLNLNSTGQFLLDVAVGIPEAWRARQVDYYGAIMELWGSVLRNDWREMDEPGVGSREFDAVARQSNRYITEWCAPQGIIDVIGLKLMADRNRFCSIAFGRHKTFGNISDREIRIAKLLAPHLRRAVTISSMLEAATVAAASFELVLDALTVAVFLVDGESRLLHSNRAGKAMLGEGDAVRLTQGALRCALQASSTALSHALGLASHGDAAMGRFGIGLLAPGRESAAKIASVLPLREGNVRRRWAPGAVAAVFVTPADDPAAVPAEALVALYDLTPAEARIMLAIAAGQAPVDIAVGLGIAESTIRTHLVRIYAKTETGRQLDLARLVHSLTLPVRH